MKSSEIIASVREGVFTQPGPEAAVGQRQKTARNGHFRVSIIRHKAVNLTTDLAASPALREQRGTSEGIHTVDASG